MAGVGFDLAGRHDRGSVGVVGQSRVDAAEDIADDVCAAGRSSDQVADVAVRCPAFEHDAGAALIRRPLPQHGRCAVGL
jgi:hypothetical protein